MTKKSTILFVVILLSVICCLLSISVVSALELKNPLSSDGEPLSLAVLYSRIIKAFLGVVGILAFLFLIVGGFMWLTSAGNPDKIKKGTATIVWAVIGLIVVLLSYTIVHFVMKSLMG